MKKTLKQPAAKKDLLGHPYFALLRITSSSSWEILIELCRGFLLDDDCDKLKSCLSGYCKTIIIEYDYVDMDYRDTYSNFYSKKFASYPDKTIRLLFFSTSDIFKDNFFNVELYSKFFIGYSVIRPTRINSLGRTIIDPKRCATKDKFNGTIDFNGNSQECKGYIATTNFKLHLLGTELVVNGFPFISQTTDLTKCSHASCWMAFRYISETHSTVRRICPYQITQLTSDYSSGRLVPSHGLRMSQVSEVFSREGLFPLVYVKETWKQKEKEEDFFRYLYYYIESGLTPIVGLPRHTATTVGHYSTRNVEFSERITYSNHFLKGLIVNDDNDFPYQPIAARESDMKIMDGKWCFENIDSFVVPLSEKMFLTAEQAEPLITAQINDEETSIYTQKDFFGVDRIVLRLFISSSSKFKTSLMGRIPDNKCLEGLLSWPMPHYIWVAEISTPDIYPEKIWGEIILDATASHFEERSAILAVHYPNMLVLNDRNEVAGKKTRTEVLQATKSYPLFKSNLSTLDNGGDHV